jgi:parallel beta-helix repeat protein
MRLLAIVALVLFARAVSASPPRCTVTLSPRDDVQRAIDHLGAALPAARGGVVCLGAGEFRLARMLVVDRDGVTLRGRGPSTVLRLADGVQSPVVVIGDHEHETPERPTSDVTIERLRIVGGGREGREADGEWPYLTNSAVVVRAGRNVMLRELDVSGCRSACLLTEKDTRDVSMIDNRIEGSVWDGISLNRTARARVADNVVRGNTASGITAEHLEDSVLERNVLEGNKTHGIYLADSYRNRFTDNRFVRNVLSGVFLTCAVRLREPPVACWDDSMSAGNVFERNELTGNRIAFTLAPDDRARCTSPRFVPNRSRDDRFAGNPRTEPYPPAFGTCVAFQP